MRASSDGHEAVKAPIASRLWKAASTHVSKKVPRRGFRTPTIAELSENENQVKNRRNSLKRKLVSAMGGAAECQVSLFT